MYQLFVRYDQVGADTVLRTMVTREVTPERILNTFCRVKDLRPSRRQQREKRQLLTMIRENPAQFNQLVFTDHYTDDTTLTALLMYCGGPQEVALLPPRSGWQRVGQLRRQIMMLFTWV